MQSACGLAASAISSSPPKMLGYHWTGPSVEGWRVPDRVLGKLGLCSLCDPQGTSSAGGCIAILSSDALGTAEASQRSIWQALRHAVSALGWLCWGRPVNPPRPFSGRAPLGRCASGGPDPCSGGRFGHQGWVEPCHLPARADHCL
ncbi:hypothetical protein NDU88_008016 [Pleurodeles waltl]|uniref:Uncharacterized protein n=1 Tax=Pleurodeles waltl TaxID=8319 RepID=A0AAV7RWJ2_PLEWA|nr:hypothetical protein NDU88_008016 [Pleurodeles waltl]